MSVSEHQGRENSSAAGLGRKACHAGIENYFWRVSDLVLALEIAWQDKQLSQFKKRFSRINLIILDEMGYVPFTKMGQNYSFNSLVTGRNKKALLSYLTLNLIVGISFSLSYD